MDRKVAKDLLHVRDWLDRAHDIVSRGQDVYAGDALLQEAGDSRMMKLGEASTRLARANVEPPPGVAWSDAIANRNWLIHQYDQIDRRLTWVTLTRDPPDGERPSSHCSIGRGKRWRPSSPKPADQIRASS